MRNVLYSIFSDVQVSRQLMFDVTEIPHCLEDLSSTFFALDMKRLKTAHQYMKGTIPDKMYQKIKSKLQKHLAVLLKSHKQLLRIELDQIEDEATFQLYNFTKRYFSSCKVESSFQLGSLAPHSIDSNEILSTDMLSDEMDC